nr:hypothetical protein [Tanacetum cinerariifolium]
LTEELLLAECYIHISEDPNVGSEQKNEMLWYKVLDQYNEQAKINKFPIHTKNMLTRKWTPMNREVGRRNRGRVTEEEPELFGDDELPRPLDKQRIAKGVKDKPQVGSLSPRKWRTRDMIVAAKHGDRVLNVQPVSEFNPTTGIQVLKPLVKDKSLVKKPLFVRDKVKDKASVKKPADIVEKPDKVKDKAMVNKPVTVVVKDKVTVKKLAIVATVKKPANVVEKPAILVKDKMLVSIVKDKDVVPDLGLEKVVANDKENKIINDVVSDVGLEKVVANDKEESDVVNNKDKESDVAKDVGNDVVNDFVNGVVNDVVADVGLDKFGANELLSDVVSKNRRRRTELPKVNAPTAMADKPFVEKSVVKAVVKPAVKPDVKSALKPAVKGNESKKLKSKSGMKRKMKNSYDSLSSSVDEKELRRLLKKLKILNKKTLTGTQSMFDGTLATDNAKWEIISNQVKAQFSGNEGVFSNFQSRAFLCYRL